MNLEKCYRNILKKINKNNNYRLISTSYSKEEVEEVCDESPVEDGTDGNLSPICCSATADAS